MHSLSLVEALRQLRGAVEAEYGLHAERILLFVLEKPKPLSLYLPGDGPNRGAAPPPKNRHSADFSTVCWLGAAYTFSPAQRAVVRQLWQAWEDGTPGLGQEALLEGADSQAGRLRDLFRDHPAWGILIVPAGKGIFRLAEG